eukprot:CAMPEP_0174292156 /NCGR_PEP_ID=MMETSP0809-20121228/34472_1 /TAXON_ID=73025 ORGANISM="Eutreptiella gymnastica-like, Strain CCMP1594" /NCGR_SAMPLE_ID=MMETSP0809 /ASSEMBLY_ACC=CAM_ASM_000658 /LENGTH=68 /DNA_ID=CAMNT_0015392027 /DNA_START=750 /DNA_END=956 /DNA_ORIENTATION=+
MTRSCLPLASTISEMDRKRRALLGHAPGKAHSLVSCGCAKGGYYQAHDEELISIATRFPLRDASGVSV